ncbi:ATP/GTP-binding protein [Wenjunlia vitaminophila]|uniref:ATP/GTP-binding protein n=1 Tax=Wenjunlia vitaminophila TaxID=76728 RepID=A0A0T6LTN3_WENVI|nr:hypothetical protein [Wenjunlia vitaminophila]KRV49511.1 ATP/GTP-binding protein [Wenjunlia vitaminophila]
MSPRRNRPRRVARNEPPAPSVGSGYGLERTESWRGEEWVVRPVAGASGKRYRCPGCDQEIPSGVGHVVAWPVYGGVDDRRHWHRACWNARDRRGAQVLRARGAPRY